MFKCQHNLWRCTSVSRLPIPIRHSILYNVRQPPPSLSPLPLPYLCPTTNGYHCVVANLFPNMHMCAVDFFPSAFCWKMLSLRVKFSFIISILRFSREFLCLYLLSHSIASLSIHLRLSNENWIFPSSDNLEHDYIFVLWDHPIDSFSFISLCLCEIEFFATFYTKL